MKKILIFTILGMIFTSCFKEVIPEKTVIKPNIIIEELFTHDGIKVYRFLDNGRYHYFTKDMTISTKNCGKGCNYQEVIKKQ